MKYFFYLIFFSLLLICMNIFPQQNSADSLTLQLQKLSGVKKVDALGELSDIYQYINTAKAIDYAEQGIALALELKYQKGLAACYGSLGFSYINMDHTKAKEFTLKALKLRESLNDKPGIATSLNVMGVIHYYEDNYLESIEYHLKALQIREEIGDVEKLATSFNNISLVYLALEDYKTALEYLNKALEIRINSNNKRGIGVIKDNIGTIYRRAGNYDKAFVYLSDALKLNEEIGNDKSVASNHFGIAKIYEAVNDYNNALTQYKLSLDIYEKLGEKHGISINHNGIASVYQNQKLYDLAIKHAHIALINGEQINSLDNIALASNILQSAYFEKQNFQKAYLYLEMFKNTADSLMTSEKIKKLAKIELEHKVNKIKEEQASEINRQNNLILTLSISLFLALVIVILIVKGYYSNRRMNIKLNELNTKLKEINSTKDRFLSIIAHDLRGPFQGMLAYSGFLAYETDNMSKKEIKEYSSGLNELIESQYELLNDLLDWSKLQNENFKTNPEIINLRQELNELIESLKFTADAKNINIKNDIKDDFKVYADKNMLRLVLRNLISNSIKFSSNNGFVKISAARKNGFHEIKVTDNGIGLSDQDQEKLFKMDIHHSTKGTAGESGTGIGLLLAKEIVEKHSGEIKVKSEEGKGSTFSFTLKSPEFKN